MNEEIKAKPLLQNNTEELFDVVMIPVLEDAFKGAHVLVTPFDEICSFEYDDSLNEDFDDFDRNLDLFQKFYKTFKEIILPKIETENVSLDVDTVCTEFLQNAFKNQIFDDQAPNAATKYDLLAFEVSEELLGKIMDGISSYNIQNIKQESLPIKIESKLRKQLKPF